MLYLLPKKRSSLEGRFKGIVIVGDRRSEFREFPVPVSQALQALLDIKAFECRQIRLKAGFHF
jgi:hypothetical protein